MKKAIVTGGAGFIGSNLVKLLLQKGWDVVVIDDFSVGSKDNLPTADKKLKIIKASITNKEMVLQSIKNCDSVFHLAVQCIRKSIRNPFDVHKVNTLGTLNILEASKMNKINQFVYVSSSEVYGSAILVPMDESHPVNPTTVYGASKLAGEFYTLAYLRSYGLKSIIVRPFNSYGYNAHFEGVYGEVIPRFLVRALNNKPLQIFGDGEQTRDFTFVSDTALGILLASQKGKVGEIYNLAYGKEVSINHLAKLILIILNKDLSKLQYRYGRPGDIQRLYAKNQIAVDQLGFKPKIDIKMGLKLYIQWFVNKYPDPEKLLKYYEQKNW